MFYWNLGNKVGLANSISIDKIPKARNKITSYKTNQKENGYATWCVFHAWAWCIIDNYWEKVKWFIEKLWEKAPNYRRKEWEWMEMDEWVKLCIDTWNELYPDDELIYYEIDMNNQEDVDYILDLWYSIHSGYGGNQMYNADRREDCCLDNSDFKNATYYHSVRLTGTQLVKNCNWELWIRDNYEGRPCNDYGVKNFEELVNNWVFFQHGYIYIFKNDIMPDHITQENATTANRSGIIGAWENEITTNYMNFSVYNTKEKPWTREYELDEWDIITKMLIDIQKVREG